MKDAKYQTVSPLVYLRRESLPKRKAIVSIRYRFGLRLKELRLRGGMTQEEMAEKFGIDRSFVSDVERGIKAPNLLMLEVFALGLRVKLSELFDGL